MNRFLKEEFLPSYNSRYEREGESEYRELPKGIDLDRIFSIKKWRRVKKGNTISYDGEVYQVLGGGGIRGYDSRVVEISEGLDGGSEGIL